MNKKEHKPKPTMEELIEKHEEFVKEKGLDEITKEEYEENLKKLVKVVSPKQDKK
nr:hypothetical protein [uncultured Fluviicola sp.]